LPPVANTIDLLYDATLALLYPQACAVCGGSVESRFDGVACAACWAETEVFDGDEAQCWKCGAISLAAVVPEQREQIRCRQCDADEFDAARACGPYDGALRAAVIALKREPFVAGRLAAILSAAAQRAPLNQATLIVPVPLHPEREKQRGFNQAAVIGKALSRLNRLPIDADALARVEYSGLHRVGMDARARRESVENAFAVTNVRAIEGERILLVDDVFTTGATASACAAVLKDAGAVQVLALTLARPRQF
jgi:ComF family protein